MLHSDSIKLDYLFKTVPGVFDSEYTIHAIQYMPSLIEAIFLVILIDKVLDSIVLQAV